jgi:hypothetical protein
MTEVQESASPEVRHRHREVHSRVNKFAQNLHVLKMAIKAEEEGLDPRFKQARFFALHRLRGKVRHVGQCLFVLQQYVHCFVGCGYAAIDCLDFEFSRTREGHLGSRPGKQARSITTYHPLGACQEPVKKEPVKKGKWSVGLGSGNSAVAPRRNGPRTFTPGSEVARLPSQTATRSSYHLAWKASVMRPRRAPA